MRCLASIARIKARKCSGLSRLVAASERRLQHVWTGGEVHSVKQYFFGIDIGGTSIKSGLFTAEGGLLDRDRAATRKEENGRFVLSDTADMMRRQLRRNGLSMDDVAGAGICVPGPVQQAAVVNGCVNIGWGKVDVCRSLGELTGLKRICCANDANAAALGEVHQGAGKAYDSIMMITLGTGIGGGVIYDGRPMEGAAGAAGEIGHMYILPPSSALCQDTKPHWLEHYAAAAGIVHRAETAMQSASYCTSVLHVLKRAGALTPKDVFDAAQAGDEAALAVAEFTGDVLGRALASCAGVLDPEAFIIGGGIAAAGDVLLDPIRRAYRRYAFHPSADTPILPAVLGNDAGMVGCAGLIRQMIMA